MPADVTEALDYLNLPYLSSRRDVIQRFRYRARNEHPDKWNENSGTSYRECTEKFQVLFAAYETAKSYIV